MTIRKLLIAEPLQTLKVMLSESAAVQTLLGVADAEDALLKIHKGYAEDGEFRGHQVSSLSNFVIPVDQRPKPLPRVLIAVEKPTFTKSGTSSWNGSLDFSLLLEVLTLPDDVEKSAADRYEAFLERVEGVIDDLREQAADLTKLNLQRIAAEIAPQMVSPKNAADDEVWIAAFLLTVEA